ncbi:MAG: peptide chain release factor N(5)-glutamine methyltransferase [Chthoniobacterales bacterium]
MTVLDVIVSATGYLEKQGVENPRLNAEHLLAHTLGLKRLQLYMEFDRPLSDSERAPLRELVKSRAAGVPLQHLMGTAAFFGRDFLCDSRALIPRPETEQLVEIVLKEFKNDPSPIVLDVGTGSGVIALTVALERPDATVHATDISPAALALAAENATRHGLADRVIFHQADLLPPDFRTADCIIANLPYIPQGEIAGLSREVRHDPVLALDGGADGLDLVRRLAADAETNVQSAFLIALEIGHDQAAGVCDLLASHNFRDIRSLRDYQGVERFVLAKYG